MTPETLEAIKAKLSSLAVLEAIALAQALEREWKVPGPEAALKARAGRAAPAYGGAPMPTHRRGR